MLMIVIALTAFFIVLVGAAVVAGILWLHRHNEPSASSAASYRSRDPYAHTTWDSVAVYNSEGGEVDNRTYDKSAIQVATMDFSEESVPYSEPIYSVVDPTTRRTPKRTLSLTSFKDAQPVTIQVEEPMPVADAVKVFEHEGDLSTASLSTLTSEGEADEYGKHHKTAELDPDDSIVLSPLRLLRQRSQELHV